LNRRWSIALHLLRLVAALLLEIRRLAQSLT
jgi:hypothetical protein